MEGYVLGVLQKDLHMGPLVEYFKTAALERSR